MVDHRLLQAELQYKAAAYQQVYMKLAFVMLNY